MELKTIAEMIEKLNRAGQDFLECYRDEISDFLKGDEVSAEENLQKELLLELLDHVYGINHIAEYVNREKLRVGTLERGSDGEILFDGEVLQLMTELEVYIFDPVLERNVWTRAYVGGLKEKKYLVGMDKSMEIGGIPARIRE